MKRIRKHHGFTLVEILLAVTIMALIMTSIGAAIQASIHSYKANDDISSVTQLTRMVMSRMMGEVRTAVDIDSTSSYLTITPSPNADNITQIRYEYSGGALNRSQTVAGDTTNQVLIGADGDPAISFFSVVREDDLEGQPVSVTVRISLSVGEQDMSMTSSACLRKRQLY